MLKTNDDSPHVKVEPTQQGHLTNRQGDDYAQQKQANILLLHHNKVDCNKYLRISFEIKLNKKIKKTKTKIITLFNMFKN
jgi:hypothetical protein